MRVAVLTVSDRCSRGEAEDRGGPAVAEAAGRLPGAEIVARETVADDRAVVAERIRALAEVADLVLTTGGTGIGARDVTPEATADAVEVEIPGLAERMRLASADRVPAALLSRGRAGALGRAIVLNLPGRPEGAVECLETVAAALPHAVELRRRPGEDVHAAPGGDGGER